MIPTDSCGPEAKKALQKASKGLTAAGKTLLGQAALSCKFSDKPKKTVKPKAPKPKSRKQK
jgi:hypothetical protein